MKLIPSLKKMVTARNIIVKQSSLATSSKVSCGLFRGRRMKLSINIEVDPLTDTRPVLAATTKFVGNLFLGDKHEQIGEQAGVERTWIVTELGEMEVISECLQCLNYMLVLVDGAHRLWGVYGILCKRSFVNSVTSALRTGS